MMFNNKIIRAALILISVLAICCVSICIVWPTIKSQIMVKGVLNTVERICEYEHISVQITKGAPTSTDMFCGMFAEDVEVKKIVGEPTGLNRKESNVHMEYAFDIVIVTPDKSEKITIKMHKISGLKDSEEALKDYEVEYNGNFYIATIEDMIFAVGKIQIVDLIECVIQIDRKFDSDIVYSSFFGKRQV